MSFARSNTCGQCGKPIRELDWFCSDLCEMAAADDEEASAPVSKYAASRLSCAYCENPVPPGEQFCCTGCQAACEFFDQEDAQSAVLDASTERRAA